MTSRISSRTHPVGIAVAKIHPTPDLVVNKSSTNGTAGAGATSDRGRLADVLARIVVVEITVLLSMEPGCCLTRLLLLVKFKLVISLLRMLALGAADIGCFDL